MLDGFSVRRGATPSVFQSNRGQISRRAEPYPARPYLYGGQARVAGRVAALIGFGWSDQNEIEQREEGRSDGGGDQREVGADVRLGVERWLVGFPSHTGDLGQVGQVVCEAGHIWPIFFNSRLSGTGWRHRG